MATSRIGLDKLTVPGDTGADLIAYFNSNMDKLDALLATHKFDATRDPTVNDDNLLGYEIGSWWINRIGNKMFICADNSTGAAVWDQLYPSPAGDVTGPESSVDEDVVIFSGTTGKLIAGSGASKTNLLDAIAKKHTQAEDDNFDGLTEDSAIANTDYLLYRKVSGSVYRKVKLSDLIKNHAYRSLQVILDGAGAAIAADMQAEIIVDVPCTITRGRLEAIPISGQSNGSIVIDVWKKARGTGKPTDLDSITASAPLTISSDVTSEDSTLTGWIKTLADGDILRFNVDSCTNLIKCTISLKVVVTHG